MWKTFSRTLMYAANLVGEIADDIYSIDNALKWGFGWELGPFEVLDAIGLEYFVERYGEVVLMEPSANGFGLIAWIVPWVAFISTVFLVIILIRRMSSTANSEEVER